MSRLLLRFSLAMVSVSVLAVIPCLSQTTTGAISGTVRDASDAVVTDAKVTVRN